MSDNTLVNEETEIQFLHSLCPHLVNHLGMHWVVSFNKHSSMCWKLTMCFKVFLHLNRFQLTFRFLLYSIITDGKFPEAKEFSHKQQFSWKWNPLKNLLSQWLLTHTNNKTYSSATYNSLWKGIAHVTCLSPREQEPSFWLKLNEDIQMWVFVTPHHFTGNTFTLNHLPTLGRFRSSATVQSFD